MVGAYLTSAEKARIIAWREENVPIKEICNRSGRGKATVMRLLSSAKGLPPNVVPEHKIIAGRPRKTTKATDKLLKREVLKNPRVTSGQLKADHPEVLQNVSVRTVQHRLQKDLLLPCRTAARKPLLNERMRKARLAFANKYKHWTSEQWSTVMWSDESTFQSFRNVPGKVRRPSTASRYDPKFTMPTVKHPTSVMVWGCFSASGGRGGLYFLPKNAYMNGDRYIEVLNDHLLPSFHIHNSRIFMHDSAPCHKARKVKKWLDERKINVLEWPGNSPDLNPIENCWHIMKNKVCAKNPSSLEDLKDVIKKVWCLEMSPEYFKNLSDSMPERLNLVIQSKGNMTKY